MFTKLDQVPESVTKDYDAIVVAANILLETLNKHAHDEITEINRYDFTNIKGFLSNILTQVLARPTPSSECKSGTCHL